MTVHTTIEGDWYPGTLPGNVECAEGAEIDSTYGFTRFESMQFPGLEMSRGSAAYGTSFVVGNHGHVTVGEFTCLNSATIICDASISIGSHCLVSWGVVISDVSVEERVPESVHTQALEQAAADPARILPALLRPRPVVIEDVVWIGFGSVVLPGVTIGRGSVIGGKTIVDRDVPPGSVVVGNPFRIVRTIDVPDSAHGTDKSCTP